jgi:ribonuclease HII
MSLLRWRSWREATDEVSFSATCDNPPPRAKTLATVPSTLNCPSTGLDPTPQHCDDSHVIPPPDFSFEEHAITLGLIPCGVDEAGRGPWAGPVVAAAVMLNPDSIPQGLNDSKKLSEAKREQLFAQIMQSATVGVGIISARQIDELNILQATYLAMKNAIARLNSPPTLALIDGNRAPDLSIRTQTIVAGDAKCLSIAAASIIAKVTRDRIMQDLDAQFPKYGFAAHKGYGTALHMQALQQFGPCSEHRKSYKPVAALTMSGQFDSPRSPEDS